MDFTPFDTRHYPTLPPRDGYAQWARTYDQTCLDLMDYRLLDRFQSIPWHALHRAADLACGTGRTAAWLRAHRVPAIHRVDLTPEMVAHARDRGVHDTLHLADIRHTPLDPATYDLVICSLADQHLPDLTPLYAEATRLATPGANLMLISFHPFTALGAPAAEPIVPCPEGECLPESHHPMQPPPSEMIPLPGAIC